MSEKLERVTVDQAAADPTNVHEIRPYGYVPIASVRIVADSWLKIEYANGGSTAGIPKHWPAFVRITNDGE
jgi:hypothetical protein